MPAASHASVHHRQRRRRSVGRGRSWSLNRRSPALCCMCCLPRLLTGRGMDGHGGGGATRARWAGHGGAVRLAAHLGQAVDLVDAAVDAVADRDVDQTIVSAKRHRGLGALFGERVQARARAAAEDDAQHGLHEGRDGDRRPWAGHAHQSRGRCGPGVIMGTQRLRTGAEISALGTPGGSLIGAATCRVIVMYSTETHRLARSLRRTFCASLALTVELSPAAAAAPFEMPTVRADSDTLSALYAWAADTCTIAALVGMNRLRTGSPQRLIEHTPARPSVSWQIFAIQQSLSASLRARSACLQSRNMRHVSLASPDGRPHIVISMRAPLALRCPARD